MPNEFVKDAGEAQRIERFANAVIAEFRKHPAAKQVFSEWDGDPRTLVRPLRAVVDAAVPASAVGWVLDILLLDMLGAVGILAGSPLIEVSQSFQSTVPKGRAPKKGDHIEQWVTWYFRLKVHKSASKRGIAMELAKERGNDGSRHNVDNALKLVESWFEKVILPTPNIAVLLESGQWPAASTVAPLPI
jgi:hypothetical protein